VTIYPKRLEILGNLTQGNIRELTKVQEEISLWENNFTEVTTPVFSRLLHVALQKFRHPFKDFATWKI